jgi:KDO2-lipid IV(A) lauroyltransferase
MVDAIVRRGRQRSVQNLIPSDNVRALVRDLRNKAMIVYLPDHAHVESNSVLIPFFGEPALTTIATSRLAKMSKATVLAYFFRRLPDDSGYVINIAPPLSDFPSDDPIEDTQRMVAQLEDYIRLAPEQYIWTYRRFKGRPASYPDVYRKE